MLPFNVIGEISRTIALMVRLYGNIMSGSVIVAILLSLTPYFFPVIMQLLGLLTRHDTSLHFRGAGDGIYWPQPSQCTGARKHRKKQIIRYLDK